MSCAGRRERYSEACGRLVEEPLLQQGPAVHAMGLRSTMARRRPSSSTERWHRPRGTTPPHFRPRARTSRRSCSRSRAPGAPGDVRAAPCAPPSRSSCAASNSPRRAYELAQLAGGYRQLRHPLPSPPHAKHLSKERLRLVVASLIVEDLGDVELGETRHRAVAGRLVEDLRAIVELARRATSSRAPSPSRRDCSACSPAATDRRAPRTARAQAHRKTAFSISPFSV